MARRTIQHRIGGGQRVATASRAQPGRQRVADQPSRRVTGLVAVAVVLLAGCHGAPPTRLAPSLAPSGPTSITGDAVEDLAGQLHPETSDSAAGTYEHIVSRTGDSGGTSRPVGPQQRREHWSDGAGNGRMLQAMLIDTDPDSVTVHCPATDKRWTDRIGMWDGPIPDDQNTLLLWLLPNSLDEEPGTTLNLIVMRRVTELYANRLVPRASRASLLRIIARQPGLTFNIIHNAEGRRWLTVTTTGHEPVTPSGSAAPTGRMLVFDGDTGNLIWSEVFPLTGQSSTSPHPPAASPAPSQTQRYLNITITSRGRSTDAEHPGHVCAATQ